MKRLVVVLGSVGVTCLMVWLALTLGSWGFSYRQLSFHDGRLRRMVAQKPRLEQVVAGLQAEGFPLTAAPATQADLQRLADSLAPPYQADVLRKASQWPRTRAFSGQDIVYVLFFDAEDTLRDYTCLQSPKRRSGPSPL